MAKYFYSHRDCLLKNWFKITTPKCKKFLLLVEKVAAFTPYCVDREDAASEVEASLPTGPLNQYSKTIKYLY